MRVIDSHCHVWGREFLPPSFFRHAAEGWARKVPGRTEDMIVPKLLDGVVDETGDDFVKNMDLAGVTAAFVMMVDAGAFFFGMEPATTIDRQIEYYARLQEHHRGRLFAHVAVDHRRPTCLSIVSRAVRDLNFVGIGEITPAGFTVADVALRPLMRLAADLGVPVQIHTRSGIWTELDGANLTESNPSHPIHVARLAQALPHLSLFYATPAIHIGGKQPPKRSPIARTASLTSQIGMSGSQSLMKLWLGWRRGAVCSALTVSCSRRTRSRVHGLPVRARALVNGLHFFAICPASHIRPDTASRRRRRRAFWVAMPGLSMVSN